MTRDRVVSIDYTIRLVGGEVVETSNGGIPLSYLHGRSQIVPGVERALEGCESGAEQELILAPDEGYGPRDPAGVFLVPRSAFPDGEAVGPGMVFSATRPDGRQVVFRVVQADEDLVLVDTNHPLAGKTLHVWVAVRDVREATDDELYHGHAHSHATGWQSPLPS